MKTFHTRGSRVLSHNYTPASAVRSKRVGQLPFQVHAFLQNIRCALHRGKRTRRVTSDAAFSFALLAHVSGRSLTALPLAFPLPAPSGLAGLCRLVNDYRHTHWQQHFDVLNSLIKEICAPHHHTCCNLCAEVEPVAQERA